MMPDLYTLCRKLQGARQEVRNLIVLGMRPDLAPEKREIVRQLERSARAEVKARIKALQHFLQTHRNNGASEAKLR